MAQLAQAKTLKSLSLDHTAITDAGMPALAKLAGLEDLGLGETAISDTGLAALAGLAHLAHVGPRRRRRITDAGLAHLKSFARLEELNLGRTSISDAGFAQPSSASAASPIEPGPDARDRRGPGTPQAAEEPPLCEPGAHARDRRGRASTPARAAYAPDRPVAARARPIIQARSSRCGCFIYKPSRGVRRRGFLRRCRRRTTLDRCLHGELRAQACRQIRQIILGQCAVHDLGALHLGEPARDHS